MDIGIINFRYFIKFIFNLLVLSLGKIIEGLNFFASSKSIIAYVININMSPKLTFLAAAPLTVISPEFLSPGIT
jgi:hypothetical protein